MYQTNKMKALLIQNKIMQSITRINVLLLLRERDLVLMSNEVHTN